MGDCENICCECGKVYDSLTRHTKYCIPCRKLMRQKVGKKQREKRKNIILSQGRLSGRDIQYHYFERYKSGAIRRNHLFVLTYEEFCSFWKSKCHYCQEGIKSIGLDRVDNSKGYELSNIVPCCSTCNMMKGKMSYQNFIQRCVQIAAIGKGNNTTC